MRNSGGEETPLLQANRPRKRNSLLIGYGVLLLITGAGNQLYFKKMSVSFVNYPFFVTQFTTLVYVPIFIAIVAAELAMTDWITKATLSFPKRKFFVMGAVDAVSGLLALFGAARTTGTLQLLFNNAVIPVTFICSVFFLGRTFHANQLVGSGIITLGVCVAAYLASSSGAHQGAANSIVFNLIYVSNVIPAAVSAVYKEAALNAVDIDVNYLQLWVAVWQLVFGFILMPLNTLWLLGPDAVRFVDLPSILWDGFGCLLGANTVTDDCTSELVAGGHMRTCDNCEAAWIQMAVYMLFNCSYNVCLVLVIKHGNAAILSLISTLTLPLGQLLFSIKLFNNPPDSVSPGSLIGLALIVAGLAAYELGPRAPDEASYTRLVVARPPVRGRPVGKRLGRAAAQLRGSFYARIGVIDSPLTSHTMHHRSTHLATARADAAGRP